MRSLALFFLSCVLAVFVHLWWVRDEPADSRQPVLQLLVGVLSARHHYDLRTAIRETWLGYLSNHSDFRYRVLVKFIIGQQGCTIPEEDREDQYSCTPLNITEPVTEQDVALLSKPGDLVSSGVLALSLDFRVLHPVVITKVGVFPTDPNQNFKGNVTVKLFPVEQENAIVTATFTIQSPGIYEDGIWYKAVEQFILPKGFEGTLLWESQDLTDLMTPAASKIHLNTGGGVLKLASIEAGMLPYRSTHGFPGLAGGFIFSIYDVKALKDLLDGRKNRQQDYLTRLKEEDEALQEESYHHEDIVFLDVVDTYRTVPFKLLQFYKWAVKNTDFSLLLKTDDDCFLNMDVILKNIDNKIFSRTNLWWGNFRQSWPVDRVGKWQELEYASTVYPAFACGSGYVVSKDLVEWLARNTDKLKVYQGEDVSMGIWMAAVGPKKYQDAGWLCDKDCYVDMMSSPQHTAEELRALWKYNRACGHPCGCS